MFFRVLWHLDFFRAILPNQEKFSLEYLVSHSEKFIQRSWCSGGLQSVTKTHWVASSCGWCLLFISYNWCIKYLWYFVLTLKPLLLHLTISENMATKIAQSGLSFLHLQLAFTRNPQDGIRNLLTEFANAMSESFISSVFSFFKER